MNIQTIIRMLADHFKTKGHFCRAIGVSRTTLNYWLSQQRSPNIQHLCKIKTIAEKVDPKLVDQVVQFKQEKYPYLKEAK